MNTVDQAFIKAFAKHRPADSSAQERGTTGAQAQPSDPGVESAALVLSDQHPEGLRYRVDRPTSPAASYLAAHMIMPAVEQVQSYQPADIATSTTAQVVVEDRLQALEEALRKIKESAARGASAPSKRSGRTSAREPQVDPVADALKPLVLLAAPTLYRPDLQSKELGCSVWHDPVRVRACTTTADVGGFDLHPALLDDGPVADHADLDVPCAEPATHAAPRQLDDDLAEIMSKASDVDDVVLPIGQHAAASNHGLTEAEAAALLGEIAPAAALAPFTPAWEVDAFRWPDLCAQLDTASGRKLTQSGDELYMAMQDGLKVMAITGTERQEGRTTIALSLARSAAAAGCRVAVLDADSAHPELARRLGLDAPCDWQQIQRRGQPLGEAAVASLEDRVTLFPLTIAAGDLSGRLDDPTLTAVLQELKRAFDLVVVDTQPVVAGDAPMAAATGPCEVDMALVVRNIQTTPEARCLATVVRLRAMGVRAVGIVENFTQAEEAAV
jgi:Mrp family chromosome partitioning ATPase